MGSDVRAMGSAVELPSGFLEAWREAINADTALVARARHLSTDLLIGIGAQDLLMRIREGRCEGIAQGPHLTRAVAFSLRGNADAWSAFWQPVPLPGSHDVFALVKARAFTLDGDMKMFLAHLLFFKTVLAKPRQFAEVA